MKKSAPFPSSPAAISLSIVEVRAIALRAQGLADEPVPFGTGKKGTLKAIEHLGYVQVDPISVIQRAHHHVLWSRVPDYQPEMLHSLQSPDVSVFEYWNHAASYLPTSGYRFSLPLMRKFRNQLHWAEESPELKKALRRLMTMIRKSGPLMIGDVESAPGVKSGGWSSGDPGRIERRALHELGMRGDILIRSRKGLQKIFDLPERILPAGTNLELPSETEAATFHIRRALRALGVARLPELHYMKDAGQAAVLKKALAKLLEEGEAIELRLDADPKTPLYAFKEARSLGTPLKNRMVRFLSPFDNLTIQRRRLKWLFDFDYVVEMYVPKEKRKYGYFVLPILWGDQMVGRMDCKANRAERQLLIHTLFFEPGFRDWKALQPAMKEAVVEFTRFQQCDTYRIISVEPKSFRLA